MTTEATRALCIDAERLAAWADHGLPADEAAAVELHLSRCARCQEVLAAFARSAPVAAVVIPFWARRPVQWTAGLAAAAALVFAVWTQQGERQRGQLTADVVLPESTIAGTPPQLPAAPPAVVPESRVAPAGRKIQGTREPLARAAQPVPTPPPPAPVPPPAFTAPPVTVTVEPRATPPPPPPPAPVMPPPSMTMQIPAQPIMAERSASDGFSPMTTGMIEIVAPSSPSALQDAADLRASGAGRGGGGGAGRGGGGVTAGGAARPQSSIPTRWRIVNRMRIERSTDAGATWMPVMVNPPVATPLTAGASSSQTVCWLVGRDGLVLVTADGTTFRRVPIPEVVDLVGVTAENALRAIVTAADGRVFATTDAGATWRLR